MYFWTPFRDKKTTGYGAYAVWQAILLHFQGRLDIRKYKGGVKLSKAAYSRSSPSVFEGMARQWTTGQLLEIYTIGHSRYNITWPGDIYDSWTLDTWRGWSARWTDEPLYWFRQEVRNACNEFLVNAHDVLDLFHTTGDDYPAVLQAGQNGALSPESLIVLDKLTGWISKLTPVFDGDPLWEEYTARLRAFSSILVVDDLDWRSEIQNILQ